jgi:hypothetical protein
MKRTSARKIFKDRFGQQNHFLITSLIALDYIENNEVKCPETFSTSWNPRDKVQSIKRTREFTLQSFLSYAVDGLDMYISLLNKAPKYTSDPIIESALCTAERSVYKKVENIAECLKIDKILLSLCILLITLRNNLVHAMADNTLPENYEKKRMLFRIDYLMSLKKSSGVIPMACNTCRNVLIL